VRACEREGRLHQHRRVHHGAHLKIILHSGYAHTLEVLMLRARRPLKAALCNPEARCGPAMICYEDVASATRSGRLYRRLVEPDRFS
jgi:hypothetical protein